MELEPTIVDAISNLCRKNHEGEAFGISGDDNSITDLSTTILRDGGILGFSFEDATTELSSLKAEYSSQEYARDRKAEYDALNQLELISDDAINGTTTHKDAIVAIKTKYPKE